MKHLCLLFVMIYALNSCKSDSYEKINNTSTLEEEVIKLSPNRPNLNISILVDLSDRINPNKYPNPAMNYFERDLGYIHSIVQSFEWHVRNKRSLKINDHIQLYIDPEPADNELNEKINSLNITFTKDNAKRELIKNTSTLYDSISKTIYKSAIDDDNYVGSDIWGFFKTNVKDFCVQKDHRNILVILTDGYLYHKDSRQKEKNLTSYLTPQDIRRFKLNKSNWKDRIQNQNFGFITGRDDLGELEILVLGLNPDTKNPYELDVISQYWSDWFTKMNVKQFELKTANLPANMDKLIKEFILQK